MQKRITIGIHARLAIFLVVAVLPAFAAEAHVPQHCMGKIEALDHIVQRVNKAVVRGALELGASIRLKTEFNEAFSAQQFANRDLILCIAGLRQ